MSIRSATAVVTFCLMVVVCVYAAFHLASRSPENEIIPQRSSPSPEIVPDVADAPVETVTRPPQAISQVFGRVYDEESGRGIEGILIHAVPAAGALTAVTAVSDGEGVYSHHGLSADVLYRLVYEGTTEYPSPLDPDKHTVKIVRDAPAVQVDFALTKGVYLSGRVVSEEREPVANAVVRARQVLPKYPATVEFTQETHSGENGGFGLGSFHGETGLYVLAETDDGTSGWIGPLNAQVDGSRRISGIELVLRPGGHVSGYVETTSSGILPHARIFHRRLDSGGATTSVFGVESDVHGRFALRNLAPGTYRLFAVPEGLESVHPNDGVEVTVEAAEALFNVAVPFDDGDRRVLAGMVRDTDGLPIQDVQISIQGDVHYSALTGETGSYTIPFLIEESYSVLVFHPRYRPEKAVAVPDDPHLDFVLLSGTDLAVSVLDGASSEPVPEFDVILETSGGFYTVYRVQSADGQFLAPREDLFEAEVYSPGGLGAEPAFDITVAASGYDRETQSMAFASLVEESTPELEFRLESQKALPILGQVVDSEDQPISGAEVFDPESSKSSLVSYEILARTDGDGMFRLERYDSSLRALTARHPNFITNTVSLHGLQAGRVMKIVLGTGGNLRGRVTKDGVGVPHMTIDFTALDANRGFARLGSKSTKTDASGQYSLEQLASGRAAVTSRGLQGFHHQKRDVIIQSGETAVLDFEYVSEQGGAIEGYVFVNGEAPDRFHVEIELADDGSDSQAFNGSTTIWATTQRNGYYKLESLRPGRGVLKVQASHREFSRQWRYLEVTIQPNEIQTLHIEMTDSIELMGTLAGDYRAAHVRAVPDGFDVDSWLETLKTRPLAELYGALLHNVGYARVSRNDPNFTLSGLEPGEYTLVVLVVPGEGSEHYFTEFSVEVGSERETWIDLSL